VAALAFVTPFESVDAGDLISGKYRLQRTLGAGSMGSVWAARNELTNRDFAVKFLLPGLSKNEEALNRFFLEARACGQIRHPAIVDVYDMGQAEDGSPYLVMELLEGEGFDQRLARQGYMRSVDVCRYLTTVARGLDEAHTRGLVHRDLKPANIFFAIDKSGDVTPKILDFGISKEISSEHFDFVKTHTGAVLGSPAYMSPEQARGELDIDARTDLWSLGVIMYEALTGKLPFDANNYNALMLCIITERHRPLVEVMPEVPSELSQLVDKALEKEPQKRLKSAGELADRLERIYCKLTDTPMSRPERALSVPPLDGTQAGWYQRTHTRRKPSAMTVALGGIAAIAIVGGGISVLRSVNNVAPAARVGSAVQAIVARADSELAKAVALQREHEAEDKQREAERIAREAQEKSKDRDNPPPTGGGPRPPPGKAKDDVHGGVTGPGF
jgi:eukaryotic-like serine/threonine-protein kinase